ncbi:SPO11 [Candida pseudojiufengensis]|uniref:SPO11 n=1 Tax=Candida pseudojiufengensis TaxID=497109 RepID=UPI00222567D7|nr:SPO11 [Candida pseudojiufengensis]KAI5960465.1 SPO11 [Candida pseudojiufengensis]
MSQELENPTVYIDRSKKLKNPYDTVMSLATTAWLHFKMYGSFDVRVQGLRKSLREKTRWLILIQSLASLMSSEKKIAFRKIYYQFSHVWKTVYHCYRYLKSFATIFDYELTDDLNIYFESSAKIYSDLIDGMNYKLDEEYAEIFKKVGQVDGPISVVILEKNCMLRSVKNYLEEFNQGKNEWKNFIVISGSGFPDSLVRKFLDFISKSCTKLKPIVITDYDPYGLHIYLTYKKYLKSVKYVKIKNAIYRNPELEFKKSHIVVLENLIKRDDIDKVIVEVANDMIVNKKCMSLDKHIGLSKHIHELVLSEVFTSRFDRVTHLEIEIIPAFPIEDLVKY